MNYQQQFTTTGGTGNVTWSLGGGPLPPGWTISSSGLLSGIALTDGTYTFSIKATDAANPPQTRQTSYTVLIAEPVAITSSATWPNACLNQPYSFTVQTTGGIPPIKILLNSNRWIPINNTDYGPTYSGVAGTLGTFTAVVSAIDSAQPISGASQNSSLTVVTCP